MIKFFKDISITLIKILLTTCLFLLMVGFIIMAFYKFGIIVGIFSFFFILAIAILPIWNL